ncbi:isochorismate synthase [Pseudooceanicola algae]|uniref:isochorismate synthase n=1 Tax=Pseudooceanicola algae TaxID=1537215 RepID=A0A418SFP8_9RHOB|nr:isochorismate synthase [Pseudooceanicola algae]QPM91531.1 Isochorismate synthase MenF [Pseudooceanicola algae]
MTFFPASFPSASSGLTAGSAALPYRIGSRHGIAHKWSRGSVAALAARIGESYVAALPFARSGTGMLLTGLSPATAEAAPATAPRLLTHQEVPAAADYAAAVAEAVRRLKADPAFRKVVLARGLDLTFERAPDPQALLAELSRDPVALPFLLPIHDPSREAAKQLIGASPELLLEKTGTAVRSHPLAGSARRTGHAAEDHAAAARLTDSGKDRGEHALVVEYISDTLAPLCRDFTPPGPPEVFTTDSMLHLGTPIRATLRDADHTAFDLAVRLHPTPAVGGTPMEQAERTIADLEAAPRDFFAGAIGWGDSTGDGAWHIAIRCAELLGTRARLFAGAGIVEGSDPAAETAETGAKFGTMLRALGCAALRDQL